MTPRARFLATFEHESAITLKVLRAYPKDQTSLRPHERSNSAIALAWTFVIEQRLLHDSIRGEKLFGGTGAPQPPATWDEVIEAYEKGYNEVVADLRDPKNPNLEGSVHFFVGPKQPGEIPLSQFVWFMLHDQIHHRGQLSVYLRLAGGKVPSIYGPSADEPWR